MNGNINRHTSTQDYIRQLAIENGFTQCGFAKAEPINEEADRLNVWIENGYNAEMGFFAKHLDLRRNPLNILPEAKSIIVLLKYYYQGKDSDTPPLSISRYAWGIDYHMWMKDKLGHLIQHLTEIYPGSKNIAYSDTGPAMEKVWATKAGLGRIGKHTLLINPKNGTYCFIGLIISSIEFKQDKLISEDVVNCDNCSACIQACPTGALINPGILDANKCISWLTVEKKGEFSTEEAASVNGMVFGCDICQDACPYNKNAKPCNDKDFLTSELYHHLVNDFGSLSGSSFSKIFSHSAIKRCGIKRLRRNIEASKRNTV